MFYWLFTEGKALLAGLLWPLACLSFIIPIAVAALLGVGIQRRVDGTPLKTSGWLSVARLSSFIVPRLGVIAGDTNLPGGLALPGPSERQAPLGRVSAWLRGRPRWIHRE